MIAIVNIKELRKQHKAKFGKEPNVIGMFWDDPQLVEDNILKAIETNTPYDEYELLTDEEKEAFDKGMLLF